MGRFRTAYRIAAQGSPRVGRFTLDVGRDIGPVEIYPIHYIEDSRGVAEDFLAIMEQLHGGD